MKLIHMFSIGVATAGMTCLVSYASAANTVPDDLISDSMLLAQSTPSPGGRGGGTAGEIGRADIGTPNESKLQGTPGTILGKARPVTKKDTNSERARTSSGASTGPTVVNESSGMKKSGSRPSSGTGGGGK